MYVQQRTWLENGPLPRHARRGAIAIPVPGLHRRGVGDFSTWCASGAPTSNFFETAFMAPAKLACAFTDTGVVNLGTNAAGPAAPPVPPPPGLTLSSTPGPGASYAGADASGNPVYMIPNTAQQDQQAAADQFQSFVEQQSMANPPGNTAGAFNWWVPVGIAAGVVGVLALVGKRGR
jgi:hypothetical protein